MTVGTRGYKRIERVTRGYNEFLGMQGVLRSKVGYDGLQRVT